MSFKNKNILITGVTGFIGSYLAKALIDKGANVSGLIRRRADGSKPRNLTAKTIYEQVKLCEGELSDISSVAFCLRQSKPDIIFHLAAQSFVPSSFINPINTIMTNTINTANLLEAIRLQELDSLMVFAGSSEEYGLVITSEEQYERAMARYGDVFPKPMRLPELPINEDNPLRPLSPYALSKVQSDFLTRSYHTSYGLRTIVSRGFNTEGAGRGIQFVTSVITCQVMRLKMRETNKIVTGNVNAFRDWSHVSDIVEGYCLLADRGKVGDIYNQGSSRTNSILTFILLSLQNAGYGVKYIESMVNGKRIINPTEMDNTELFGVNFTKTKVDRLMLQEGLEFDIEDKGIWVHTDKGKIPIEFDPNRYRPTDVPILLSNTAKIQDIGFRISHTLEDIINDQLNYFMSGENRSLG